MNQGKQEEKEMAKSFSYKLTTTKAMKVAGIIDTDAMTMDVDGEEKDLSKLLSEYNGSIVEVVVRTKDEQDLDEPDLDEPDSSNEEE